MVSKNSVQRILKQVINQYNLQTKKSTKMDVTKISLPRGIIEVVHSEYKVTSIYVLHECF